MRKCICLFMSWGNGWGTTHWPSYWSSLHLVISTKQCLFMSHEECICFFMSWEISHWPSHWPSSHLTISINQCLFMSNVFAISSHQEMHGLCHIAHHICLFIISPSTCHFIAQTLLHGVNDIWVHIWAKNIFSQLSFLKSHTFY